MNIKRAYEKPVGLFRGRMQKSLRQITILQQPEEKFFILLGTIIDIFLDNSVFGWPTGTFDSSVENRTIVSESEKRGSLIRRSVHSEILSLEDSWFLDAQGQRDYITSIEDIKILLGIQKKKSK